MTQPKTYEIRTIRDLLAVPAEKRPNGTRQYGSVKPPYATEAAPCARDWRE